MGNVSDTWFYVTRFYSTFLGAQCGAFEGATDRGFLFSHGKRLLELFSLQVHLLPGDASHMSNQPATPPTLTHTDLISDQQPHNLYFLRCLKLILGFSFIIIFPSDTLISKRMLLCTAFFLLASPSLNNHPHSLIHEVHRLRPYVGACSCLVPAHFLCSQINLPATSVITHWGTPGGPIFRTSVNLWHKLLPALEISQWRSLQLA